MSPQSLEQSILNLSLTNYKSVKEFLSFQYSLAQDNFLISSPSMSALQELVQSINSPLLKEEDINTNSQSFTLEVSPSLFLSSNYFLTNAMALFSDDCASMMDTLPGPTLGQWAINLGGFFTLLDQPTIKAFSSANPQTMNAISALYQIAGMMGLDGEALQKSQSIKP